MNVKKVNFKFLILIFSFISILSWNLRCMAQMIETFDDVVDVLPQATDQISKTSDEENILPQTIPQQKEVKVDEEALRRENFLKEHAGRIPVAMALDDGYIYPTMIAIISAVENANFNTKYDFYIMHPDNFSQENKNKLSDLERKYKNCFINLVNMKDMFVGAYTDNRITTPAYYRLAMSEVFPYIDKMIWIDGDTITLHDLTEMYNLNMDGLYYRGLLDFPSSERTGGTDNDHYICDGVMIANLNKLRQDHVIEKFNDYIRNNWLPEQDQTVINRVCYRNIGLIPPKFGMFNLPVWEVDYYCNSLVAWNRYSAGEVWNAWCDPCILHCVKKPWKESKASHREKWWRYAEKTGYFDDIKQRHAIRDGEYYLLSELSYYTAVDIEQASYKTGANVRLWERNWTPAQKFNVRYVGEGCYTIQSQCSGKYLDVQYGENKIGTNIWQYDYNGSDAQKWFIVNSGNGNYYIISKCNGLVMDVQSANTKKGTNIRCWQGNETAAQRFRFV